jgi:sigma-54 dependent transcriptional regulator, acetoin dehydrogenase operon transcriptional activator AcoR
MLTDEYNRRMLTARTTCLETGDADRLPGIRPEVAASWKRSLINSIDPTGVRPDYRKVNSDRLSSAAMPVIESNLQSMSGAAVGLLFADARGRLIGRWTDHTSLRQALNRSYVEAGFCMSEEVVGANGIGTSLETGAVAEFRGAEHFSDQYLGFTCVGAPIRHPISRRIVGAIDITCRLEDTATIARPWIIALAAQIEQQLLDNASVRERMLLSSYLTISQRSKRPVVCISDRMIISNPRAATLVAEIDQLVLWEAAQRVCHSAETGSTSLLLPRGGTVLVRCRAVRDEARLVGAVLELETLDVADIATPSIPAARQGRLGSQRLELNPGRSHATDQSSSDLAGLVGRSERWSSLCSDAHRARTGSGGIVVSGEPGTGKLALLRAMFDTDKTHDGGVTVVDCSLESLDGAGEWVRALRATMAAHQGVIVMSHLEALTMPAARGVCALLDNHPADGPRILATVTTGDGYAEAYRPLHDRVGIHRLSIPPLRERSEDIPDLLAAFAQRHATTSFGRRWLPEAQAAMARHPWPGNARELEAAVRRTLNGPASGPIGLGDLPHEVRANPHPRRGLSRLEQLERQEIIEALRVEGGNKVRAAGRLKLARSTLYRKMGAFGIDPE